MEGCDSSDRAGGAQRTGHPGAEGSAGGHGGHLTGPRPADGGGVHQQLAAAGPAQRGGTAQQEWAGQRGGGRLHRSMEDLPRLQARAEGRDGVQD